MVIDVLYDMSTIIEKVASEFTVLEQTKFINPVTGIPMVGTVEDRIIRGNKQPFTSTNETTRTVPETLGGFTYLSKHRLYTTEYIPFTAQIKDKNGVIYDIIESVDWKEHGNYYEYIIADCTSKAYKEVRYCLIILF